jgi:UDP-N-acetylmuramoyl-tripeptide--D-alanyl-D-alanine ligase
MGSLTNFYSWNHPSRLIALWRMYPGLGRYLKASWRTNLLLLQPVPEINLTPRERFGRHFMHGWIVLHVSLGLILFWGWAQQNTAIGWLPAVIILLSYPLVLTLIFPLARGIWKLAHPKTLFRSIMCSILEYQVNVLRKRNSFKIVGVAGSVGKTSTKMAIIRVLQSSHSVQWQDGNINDRTDVPLFYSGQSDPKNIFNVLAWIKIFINNARLLRQPYPYDFAVLELGTSRPGYIDEFRYLRPDLVVVTAVTAEHMEYFKTLDGVAEEELHVLDFSRQTLINVDDTPERYLEGKSYISYGASEAAGYRLAKRISKHAKGQSVTLLLKGKPFNLSIPLLGEQGAKIALAAAATAHILGLSLTEIRKGIQNVEAYAGRMQVFNGYRRNSLILDDTYNAAPAAVKAALDVLHCIEAPQRIAILGSMNELAYYSPEVHREMGSLCDPSKIDWVVTVGAEAKKFLAPAAKERGCKVKAFLDPYSAGKFVRQQVQEGAVVLGKGSQNGIFVEEALKPLLASKADEAKLVRQSPHWMNIKAEQFHGYAD